jgi:membrane-associated protease RseP (regulator of RpoE activity)
MPSMPAIPRIPAHLRGPALVVVAGVVAFAVAAFAATAGAQVDGAPVSGAAPAGDLGALAPLLQGAGPSGVILAALAAAWKQWRDEAARHAEERAKMREAMAALEHRVDLEAAKTAAALERIRDLIAVAEAAARSRQ